MKLALKAVLDDPAERQFILNYDGTEEVRQRSV